MNIGRTEKLSITVSVLFHALILVGLLLGLGGTGTGLSNQYMSVELFESPGGAQAPSGGHKTHASEPKRAAPVRQEVQKTYVKPRVVRKQPTQPPVVKEVQQKEDPVSQEAAQDTFKATDVAMASTDAKELAPVLPDEASQPSTSAEAGTGSGDGGQSQLGGQGGLAGVREVRIGEIRSAIQSAVVYPPLARRRGLEGTVLATFIVDAKGVPRNVQVLQSSGYGIFDREVVRVIHAASPYPAVDVAVEVPVTFRLSSLSSQ